MLSQRCSCECTTHPSVVHRGSLGSSKVARMQEQQQTLGSIQGHCTASSTGQQTNSESGYMACVTAVSISMLHPVLAGRQRAWKEIPIPCCHVSPWHQCSCFDRMAGILQSRETKAEAERKMSWGRLCIPLVDAC